MWLTVGLLASPLGVVLGYTLTHIISVNTISKAYPYGEWEWSFYIQSFGLLPIVIGILFIPNKYFDVEQTIIWKRECVARAMKKIEAN